MPTYLGDNLRLGQLANPAAPTLVRGGAAGATTYTYMVVALIGALHTAVSPAATVTNGPATLSSTQYLDITPSYVFGATAFDIYRIAGGSTQGKIATIVPRNVAGVQYQRVRDTGRTATVATPPDSNNTGQLILDGATEHALLRVGTAGVIESLVPGDAGEVLTMVDGLPAWATGGGGGSLSIGASVTDGTAGSVLFLGTDGVLAQDNDNVFWDAATRTLMLGPRNYTDFSSESFGIAGDASVPGNIILANPYDVMPGTPVILFKTANTSVVTPTVSASDDWLGSLRMMGYATGAAYHTAAEMTAQVDGTVGAVAVPGRLLLSTADSAGTLRERLRLTSQGTTGVASPDAASTIVMAGQVEVQGDLMQPGVGHVHVGPATTVAALGTLPRITWVHENVTGTGSTLLGVRASSDAYSASLYFAKAEGIAGSEITVVSGDRLGSVNFIGFDGTDYGGLGRIQGIVDGAVSSGVVPVALAFHTNSTLAEQERMRITSVGSSSISSPHVASTIVMAGQVEFQGDVMQKTGLKLGVLGATPVVQQAHIAAADLTNVHTRLNTLLTALEAYGLLAAS